MNNYEFCAEWVCGQRPAAGTRVLDYGCGAGVIVKELRRRGIEAYGCDVFYEGGDCSRAAGEEFGSVILKMEGERIPFEDDFFDFVINNQVMEHVEDLDRVLAEIRRVLKPGGAMLSLFPDKEVWREGHCGVPFLHWFPKRSRGRIYYAAAMRALGCGYHKQGKSIMRWSRDFCDWLDEWTHYREGSELRAIFGKYFGAAEGIEDRWVQMRLGRRRWMAAWLPAPVQRLLVRKLCGLVFVVRK